VVNGGYDVEFEFAIRSCLKDTRIDLDLLDTGTVELLEGCNDARLLASARWTVYEEMWEVTALRLKNVTLIRWTVPQGSFAAYSQELVSDRRAPGGS